MNRIVGGENIRLRDQHILTAVEPQFPRILRLLRREDRRYGHVFPARDFSTIASALDGAIPRTSMRPLLRDMLPDVVRNDSTVDQSKANSALALGDVMKK